jgi:hypothetical protein
MPAGPPGGRKVKSGPAGVTEAAADRHERAKDYLSPAVYAGAPHALRFSPAGAATPA